jgi:hypothetical protein
MHRQILCSLLLLASLTVAACGGDDEPTTPTGPTGPATVTAVFTGTLNRQGANTHPFTTDGGTVTATLTTVAPDSATVLGLSLGTWNGVSCQTVIANDRAVQGVTVIGGATGSGNLCVRLYDIGNISQETSYEVTVVHPQK